MLRYLTPLLIVGLGANLSHAQSIGESVVSGIQQLNHPVVQSTPGLPTPSPLGLVAPRISNLMSFNSSGGLATGEGRRFLLGTGFPRLGNGLGLIQNPPQSIGVGLQSGVGILAPRVGVLSQFLTSPRIPN